MRIYKVMIVLFAVLSGFLLMAESCQAQDQQLNQIVSSLFTHVEQGKPEEIVPLLTPSAERALRCGSRANRKRPAKEDLGNLVGVAGGVKEGLLQVNIRNLSVKITQKDSDMARIRVFYTLEQEKGAKKPPQHRNCIIYMKKLQGQWLIDSLSNTAGE